jgi:serine/threonine protein kinase
MPEQTCPIRAQLAAYAASNLSPADLEALAAHLLCCPDCRLELERWDARADPVVAVEREDLPQTAALSPPASATGLTTEVGDTPPAPPQPLPSHIGSYEVLGELGRGGMGVVYQARQAGLNRLVALKMVLAGGHAGRPELDRFRTEAQAVARLQHPNIVQIYEIGEHQGRPFLALEFIDGGNLADHLQETPLPAQPAARLMETLARAIHHAHLQGIVHRDLKPANVLLAPAPAAPAGSGPALEGPVLGTPKIADFGLAKNLDDDSRQTQTGVVVGTPSYMAPEQAVSPARTVGPATDVYALGAMLYEMLTGRPPFKGVSALDTLEQVVRDDPTPPRQLQPKVPRDLETICLKCLHKEPARRYGSALGLADDCRRFLEGRSIHARPIGPAGRVWRWCRRNPVPASLLLAVTLGAAFGMWYLSRLSGALVRYSALQGAAQQSETLDEVNSFYSAQVVDRAKRAGVEATHLYASRPGAIPVPATFTIDLGQQISAHSARGMQVRLYSDAPFRSRTDGGARDDFERKALDSLKANPTEPYYRFEDFQGLPVLRYATARRMQESCIDCHNNHPDSPRDDWQVGDVRGVLEIIRPLDKDVARTREGLRGSFWLVGGVCGGLLLASGLVLFLGNRRRGHFQA